MVSARLRRSAPHVEGCRLRWGKVAIEPENGLALYYDGKLLCADYPEARQPRTSISPMELEQLKKEGHLPKQYLPGSESWPVEVVKALSPDAVIYGLGDKTGFLNKRHYAYENWNSDDPAPHCDNFTALYKSINFFMVYSDNGCVGILSDNSYRARFDFGKEQAAYFFWSHAGGALDYYMIPVFPAREGSCQFAVQHLPVSGHRQAQAASAGYAGDCGHRACSADDRASAEQRAVLCR